jgi:hypothetical protein
MSPSDSRGWSSIEHQQVQQRRVSDTCIFTSLSTLKTYLLRIKANTLGYSTLMLSLDQNGHSIEVSRTLDLRPSSLSLKSRTPLPLLAVALRTK